MAIDPDLELQGLIVRTLKADPGVYALTGGRVYDQPPGDHPAFPYITFGSTDSSTEAPDCIDDFSVFLQLDVWSRAVGFPEAKKISDAVRVALTNPTLSLSENALVFIEHRQTRTFRDPDGLTSHAALSFEASVERRAA